MSRKLVGVLVVCVVVLVMIVSQQVGQTAPTLTALDYAEINQLYARYAFGADTGTNDGDMWARVFTEDGVIGSTNLFSGEPMQPARISGSSRDMKN